MNKIVMMLMTIFLVSCKTKHVCREVNRAHIDTVEACDVSFEYDTCRCYPFNFNKMRKVGDAIDKPLEHCENRLAFDIEDIAVEIKPKIKRLNRLKKNYCR